MTFLQFAFRFTVSVGALLTISGCASAPSAVDLRDSTGNISAFSKIAPFHSRTDRVRPLIVIVGDNQGTELSDFMIPFGVLSESDVADLVTVSTSSGPINTFTDLGKPGFRIVAGNTLADFDAQHPEGADYVVVPALHDSPEILKWIAGQVKKGSTLVSICNGGMVVAETDTMAGHHATAHWSTEAHRVEHHSDVLWVKNARYVADRNWISSAGVSAAIPVSMALVEAIAGPARAKALAQRLGVDNWRTEHDSDSFQLQLGSTAWPLIKVNYTNHWLHKDDSFQIPAVAGIDELKLALTYDAYSSTGRSKVYLTSRSDSQVQTRHGLTIITDDYFPGKNDTLESINLSEIDQPVGALDAALASIAKRYDQTTAQGVALVFEYPNFSLGNRRL